MPGKETRHSKFREERSEFAQVIAGHIISILSIKDKNKEILFYEERANFNRWIERGKELVNRIDASIFKE